MRKQHMSSDSTILLRGKRGHQTSDYCCHCRSTDCRPLLIKSAFKTLQRASGHNITGTEFHVSTTRLVK